jgi:hypothetical protein
VVFATGAVIGPSCTLLNPTAAIHVDWVQRILARTTTVGATAAVSALGRQGAVSLPPVLAVALRADLTATFLLGGMLQGGGLESLVQLVQNSSLVVVVAAGTVVGPAACALNHPTLAIDVPVVQAGLGVRSLVGTGTAHAGTEGTASAYPMATGLALQSVKTRSNAISASHGVGVLVGHDIVPGGVRVVFAIRQGQVDVKVKRGRTIGSDILPIGYFRGCFFHE